MHDGRVSQNRIAHVVDQETNESYDIAVWDYKGSRWSTYGNPDVLERIFKCNLSLG